MTFLRALVVTGPGVFIAQQPGTEMKNLGWVGENLFWLQEQFYGIYQENSVLKELLFNRQEKEILIGKALQW